MWNVKTLPPGFASVWCAIAWLAAGPACGQATVDREYGLVVFAPPDIYSDRSPDVAERPPIAKDIASLQEALTAAIDMGAVSRAFRLASQLTTIVPDHEAARRVLGYSQAGEHWCGGYAALQIERGFDWHPRYGWIREEDAEKWSAGQRPWGKRWIDSDDDRQRHDRIEKGWTLRTDHFHITTNHSRAAAVELAVRLERLYQLWRQLFGEFAASPRELQARLHGKPASGYRRKPFRVIYHRTRQQYNEELRVRQPQIDVTLGIYFDRDRQSHFFAGDDQDPGTIYHEAVHQLFYESRSAGRHLAALANAWITEGAACYFESLQPLEGGVYRLGAVEGGRLPAAAHRRLIDDFYVPLAELCSLGLEDLQQRQDLPRLYSQSAGLATFFMQYDGGRYREGFRDALLAVYAGQDDAGTLQETCDAPFSDLDRQYRQFLEELPNRSER